MPPCSKKFYTCFKNNALFVSVSNIKFNHIKQEKACLKMLSCSDHECSLWSVCIWLVRIIFLLAQHVGNSVENCGYVATELGAQKLNRKQAVHTHYFFASKNLCQKYPT
jgi:hypothetical protein